MFALGVMIIALYGGVYPFNVQYDSSSKICGYDGLYDELLSNRNEYWGDMYHRIPFSDELKRLIISLVQEDPVCRLTMT